MEKGFLRNLAQLGRLAKEIIFPRRCMACSCEIDEGIFCSACRRGHSSQGWLPPREELEGVYVVFAYEHGIKQAIWQIKFEQNYQLPELLGEELLLAMDRQRLLAGLGSQPFLLTGIPTDKKRLRARGFDLPTSMFKPFFAREHWQQRQLLERVRPTLPMFELSPEERRLNLQGCFKVTESVSGKNILVVDDIFTTGATMQEAARILRAEGAKGVWGLAFCSALDNIQR